MAIRLLIDEDMQSHHLVSLLKMFGHDVATVGGEALESSDDAAVLTRTIAVGRVILTRNVDDFLDLHKASSAHPGILAVFRDRDSRKNMSYADIAVAIANLEASDIALAGQVIPLNEWQ